MTARENEIVVYQPNETVRKNVQLENEAQKKEQIESDAYLGVVTVDMFAECGRAGAR